jgi:hypothetical protein
MRNVQRKKTFEEAYNSLRFDAKIGYWLIRAGMMIKGLSGAILIQIGLRVMSYRIMRQAQRLLAEMKAHIDKQEQDKPSKRKVRKVRKTYKIHKVSHGH